MKISTRLNARKTLLTLTIIIGTSIGVNAQCAPTTNKLIDEMGQQYELSTPYAVIGEELFLNTQGKVTRANGEFVGYATQISAIVTSENIDDIIKNLGGADGLKKMSGL